MRQELSHADIARLQDKVIDDYFWKYYCNQEAGLCSLCGNSGVIDTRETANSGANVKAGRLNYCLCPNGRAMREANATLATQTRTWRDQICKKCKVRCGDNTSKYCEYGDDSQGKNEHRWEYPQTQVSI